MLEVNVVQGLWNLIIIIAFGNVVWLQTLFFIITDTKKIPGVDAARISQISELPLCFSSLKQKSKTFQ